MSWNEILYIGALVYILVLFLVLRFFRNSKRMGDMSGSWDELRRKERDGKTIK